MRIIESVSRIECWSDNSRSFTPFGTNCVRKHLLRLLILLAISAGVSAQSTSPAKADSLQENLRKHIAYLASEKLEGRRTGTEGATVAAGYIANQFAKLRLRPGSRGTDGRAGYLQSFPYASAGQPTVTGYNVIGILDGTDPVLRREAIVVGAHYDHLGKGGQGSLAANSTEIHYGADDNASGTAAIVELARQFVQEKRNKRTIIFIAFSGEEEGLFGSKHYVNNPVFPIENTVAMFNLDMVGRLNAEKLTIGGVGTATEWKALIEKTNSVKAPRPETLTAEDRRLYEKVKRNFRFAKVNSLGLFLDVSNAEVTLLGSLPKAELAKAMQAAWNAKPAKVTNAVDPSSWIIRYRSAPFSLQLNEDGFGPSDHSSFYTKKIPVLFFFTGTHLDYHKPSDTADKINYDGLSRVAEYAASLITSIDQYPTRPTYAVAKSTGTPGGNRTGFNISLGTIPGYADSTDGMTIDGVRDNSPASRAGLKGGDKIVMLAGKEVKNVQDYTRLLGEMQADVEYEIVVVRGTERLNLKITPVKRQ